MATFTNQTSNISALVPKFIQLLKVTEVQASGDKNLEEKEKEVKSFLSRQNDRVERIEEELLVATQEVFPPSTESKTLTELAELCRLTQIATRQKLGILKRRFEGAGFVVESPTKCSAAEDTVDLLRDGKFGQATTGGVFHRSGLASSPSSTQNQLHYLATIGDPLESVLEADAETDGATTTGSSFLLSPLQSSRPSSMMKASRSATSKSKNEPHRRNSFDESPATPPTMEHVSLSAGTKTLLRNMEAKKLSLGNDESRAPSSPQSSSRQRLSFATAKTQRLLISHNTHHPHDQHGLRTLNFEFHDEDDMITLETQSTLPRNNSPVRNNSIRMTPYSSTAVKERSNFFSRMEGVLDRVEETILDGNSPRMFLDELSRPSDEMYPSIKTHSLVQSSWGSQNSDIRRDSSSVTSNDGLLGSMTSKKTDFGDSHFSSEEGVSNDSDDDDSTNVVATQVAESDTWRPLCRQHPMAAESVNHDVVAVHEARRFNLPPLNARQNRPSHILVDTAIASPAHTNITMDATAMNDTYTSTFGIDTVREGRIEVVEEIDGGGDTYDNTDNLSTATPVLDRYRLDPDDTSIGVKVVPNERRRSHQKGSRSKKTGTSTVNATISERKQGVNALMKDSCKRPKTPHQASSLPFFSPSDFLSPQATTVSGFLPSSIASNIKKVYRKTPFPTRKTNFDDDSASLPTLNENDHPNVSTGSSVVASTEHFRSSVPSDPISISVPPLRPRSFEPRQVGSHLAFTGRDFFLPAFKADKSGDDIQVSRGAREESASLYHIDKTIERIEKDLTSGVEKLDFSSGRIDPVGKSFLFQAKLVSKSSSVIKQGGWMKKITFAEFEAAPRIVRTQVSINEANAALDLIQEFCSYDSTDRRPSIQFSEDRGHEILESLSGSKHRSKSILISLCHWQRLSMRRDTVGGTMVFAVNQEKIDETALVYS